MTLVPAVMSLLGGPGLVAARAGWTGCCPNVDIEGERLRARTSEQPAAAESAR